MSEVASEEYWKLLHEAITPDVVQCTMRWAWSGEPAAMPG